MNEDLKKSDDHSIVPMFAFGAGKGHAVRDDVYYFTNQIVNVIMLGKPNQPGWVLIDTGMPDNAAKIVEMAAARFGENVPPAAIILTHGHFDHTGNVVDLLQRWNVPVYAHLMEFPFLTGRTAYPMPDTTVEGGLLAKISDLYPVGPVDITAVLQPLPQDHSIPYAEGWQWVHTPGHSPGQIALFRASDRTLLSADAFITVRQDSFYKVLFQKEEVNGPPRYLTTDWNAAKASVALLKALEPALVVAGHGHHMEGNELEKGLQYLVDHFDTFAVPEHGIYVNR